MLNRVVPRRGSVAHLWVHLGHGADSPATYFEWRNILLNPSKEIGKPLLRLRREFLVRLPDERHCQGSLCRAVHGRRIR